MCSSQDTKTSTIICREVFDETSHPSNDEILDYAKRLGIDPDTEPHLLDLAREGLMAALPKGWSPCYHEASDAWYYYQTSTGTTSWEHPLDARYKELVQQMRAFKSKQLSLDDDSNATTAREMDSQQNSTMSKELQPSRVPVLQTKIPTKLAPLRKWSADLPRRKNYKRSISDFKPSTSLVIDRVSRDHKNLQYQDPKFYERPTLGSPEREMNLHEIVKRSESMSPRYERDWEQLSSKFSSEENVIDIDKWSISSLTQSDAKSIDDECNNEKLMKQLRHQKELTLSGGGSMFLKSNRSRDNTPSQDGAKLEDFKTTEVYNNDNSSLERPKSILREKLPEEDDRHIDEEKKSVRFDLEKNPEDIKFNFSDSKDDDWDSDISLSKSEDKNNKHRKVVENRLDSEIYIDTDHVETTDIENDFEINSLKEKASKLVTTNTKIIGNRFQVKNVSEMEHFSQISKEDIHDVDITNKFSRIKNIDLVSKSDTESNSPRIISKSENDSKSKTDFELNSNSKMKTNEFDNVNSLVSTAEQKVGENCRNSNLDTSEQHENQMSFQKELGDNLKIAKLEIETSFIQQKKELERDLENRLKELKCQLVQKEQDEIKKLAAEMDEARRKNLEKVRTELEACYEKERQEIFEKLKNELDEKKQELLELRNREIEKMENEFDKTLDEEKALKFAEHEITQRHNAKIEEMKKELEKEFDDLRNELRVQQREKMTKITEDNEKCLAEILRDFRNEESTARKVYKQRLEEIRADFSREIEKEMKKMSEKATLQELVDFEKIRCEKRLLEDKYKTLKEKYMKLKNDVRLAVERRSKRKEGNTTTSETEKSASIRTRTDKSESSAQKTSSKNVSTSSKAEAHNPNIADNSESQRSSRLQRFSSFGDSKGGKFESDDTTTASETMNSNTLKKKKIFAKRATSIQKIPSHSNIHNNNINNSDNNNSSSNNNISFTDNPVENIRKQLEKLEDLGDQLPTNESAYTLRYPFQDKIPVNTSSELEFFRHRIHVERDSVKRARETLKVQHNIFQGVQKAWKERSAKSTLEQLVQEERDLSDMEVSLHRTKSLLGEKVIHLKHLEQSLERIANAKKNEAEATMLKSEEVTLSDISSASSGFSSTDLDKPDYYQESTEIIASLENLNSEIREIWSVLNKRRGNTIPPPPSLLSTDLRWSTHQHQASVHSSLQGFGTPNIQSNILSRLTLTTPPTTTTQNIIAQYGPTSGFTTSVGTVERGSSNLVERTKNMRDWLRQARIETTNIISSGQATL